MVSGVDDLYFLSCAVKPPWVSTLRHKIDRGKSDKGFIDLHVTQPLTETFHKVNNLPSNHLGPTVWRRPRP